MEHKENCKRYYIDRTGYVCYFCKVKCTKHGEHNKSLEHHINMAKCLNIHLELTYTKKEIELKRK